MLFILLMVYYLYISYAHLFRLYRCGPYRPRPGVLFLQRVPQGVAGDGGRRGQGRCAVDTALTRG